MTDMRETMCDLLMCLDPHPPATPDYAEALRIVEEWLAANPETEWINVTDKLPPQGEPCVFRYEGVGWWAGMHTVGQAISMETGTGGWRPCTQWKPMPEETT